MFCTIILLYITSVSHKIILVTFQIRNKTNASRGTYFQLTVFTNLKIYTSNQIHSTMFFLKDFIYLFFRERGREGERQRNINVCLPLLCPLLGGTWPAPGTWSDWELNPQPFGSQASAQSTEPHQPGLNNVFLKSGSGNLVNRLF